MSGIVAPSGYLPDDAYFLSADNPNATVDQRELEEVALRLLGRPDILRARAAASHLWTNAMAYPAADQMSRFEDMIDEYVCNFVLRAVCTDAAYPKVLRLNEPPHNWFGHALPGSRWGGASPNFSYRMIPIVHGGRYEILSRPTCADPPTQTYTLMENMPSLATLGILDSLDLIAGERGEVRITIDATPADGRPNHLQTRDGTFHLLVRDAIGDWLTQTPATLRVRRLDAPDRAPLSEDDFAREAVRQIMQSVFYAYYCTQSGSGQPPNAIRPPASNAAFGGMATQWGTKANLCLEPDEALVVTANEAGAQYRDVVLCDAFFISLDYWSRTGSLNMTQMAADDDGRFTYVVAHRDPGVHNWLDTGGLRRTIFGQRWQAFRRQGASETPTISARLVKFADLDREIPAGVRRIDAAGRRRQIEQRAAGFGRRFIET